MGKLSNLQLSPITVSASPTKQRWVAVGLEVKLNGNNLAIFSGQCQVVGGLNFPSHDTRSRYEGPLWALRPRSISPAPPAQAPLCGRPCVRMETDWASPFVFLSGCGPTSLALPYNPLPFSFPKAQWSQCLSIVMALMSKSGVLLHTRQGRLTVLCFFPRPVSSSEWSIEGVTDMMTVGPWSSKSCLFFRHTFSVTCLKSRKMCPPVQPSPRHRVLYMSTVSWYSQLLTHPV